MLHDLVFEYLARQIAKDLVDIHHDIPGLIVFHTYRVNAGIHNAPLSSPVSAHFVASVHAPHLPSRWAFYVALREASALSVKVTSLTLALLLVSRYDDACRRYVIPNQLHVHGVRGAAEELFAFSKNYRNDEQ